MRSAWQYSLRTIERRIASRKLKVVNIKFLYSNLKRRKRLQSVSVRNRGSTERSIGLFRIRN